MMYRRPPLFSKMLMTLWLWVLASPLLAGVGSWTAGVGQSGGYVYSYLVDPAGTEYAGTAMAGVFRRKAGSDWQLFGEGLPREDYYPFASISDLAADRTGAVYAATSKGLYKLAAGGTRWFPLTQGLDTTAGNVRIRSDAMHDVLYALMGGSVFVSADGGQSWVQEVLPIDAFASVYAFELDGSGRVYVVTWDGIFRRDPAKGGWRQLAPSTTDGFSNFTALAFGSAEQIFVATANGRVWTSSDDGANWVVVITRSENSYWINRLLVDVAGNLYGVTSYPGLLKYDAAGKSWSAIQDKVPGTQITMLMLDRDSASLLVATNLGIARSKDGGTSWKQENQGLLARWINNVAVDRKGNILAGSATGLLLSKDRGESWQAATGDLAENTPIALLAVDAGGIDYAATFNQLYKSQDNGQTWRTAGENQSIYVSALAFGENGKIYAGQLTGRVSTQSLGDLYISSNGANSFELFAGQRRGYYIHAITLAMNGDIFTGTAFGVDKFSAANNSWSASSNGLPPYTKIASLAMTAPSELYAASPEGVFRSVDAGANWIAVNTGLAHRDVKVLKLDGFGNLYAGTQRGVFIWQARQAQWQPVGSDLPRAAEMVHDLSFDAAGTVYAATSAGVYQYTPPSRFVNFSARARVAGGDQVGIAGFVVRGGSKTVLISARGPSLVAKGVPGALDNPKIRLLNSQGELIASNDDVGVGESSPTPDHTEGLPDNAQESALQLTLPEGSYTAIMEGASGHGGIGLLAVDGVVNPADRGQLVNLSFRGEAGSGDHVLIGGFMVVDSPRRILITARGPSLTNYGVSGALADPQLALYRDGELLANNDNLSEASEYAAILTSGRAPAAGNESALLQTLTPGAYTVVLRGAQGDKGVALLTVEQLD